MYAPSKMSHPLMTLRSTRAYLEALREHVLAHGRPLAFYSDRHGIFRVNAKDAASGDGKTEFGRVVARLDERTLSKALTFRVDGTIYGIKTKRAGIALRGAKVELRHHLDGAMTVHYKDRIIPVTACRTYSVPEPAEDEKTIDLRIDHIVAARHIAAPAPLEVGRG